MPQFVVLMRENDHAWAELSPKQQEDLLQKYFAWVDKLKTDKTFVGGNPLGEGGHLLRMVDGRVVDGPFTETKEVLTGYFVIEARDVAHATEIARGCPALSHGESVGLRLVGHL